MAKGYVIFTETVRDRVAYDAYVEKAIPTILESGGRPIVVQDDPEVIEGQFAPRVVVLEFDSVEAARSWYGSPAYQAVISERLASADADAAIVGEFEMPGG
jgi:uncharacterized protein (DUF1330 family)